MGRDRNALLKHYGLSHRVVASMVRKEMGGTMPAEMAEVTHDCKVCSQFFLNQNALNNHLCDSHYGPRLAKDVPYSPQSPFKCPKCNYEAKTHQMTVRHYGVKHGLLRQFMIEDGYIARDPTPPPPPPPAPTRLPPPYPEINMNRSMMNHLGHQQAAQQASPAVPIPYRTGQAHHQAYSRSPSQQSPQYGSPNQSWIEHYMSPNGSPGVKQEVEVQLGCPVQGCNATFTSPSVLLRHATDKHFVDRFARELPQAPPFLCPMCGQSTQDQISLIRHWGVAHKMALKVINEQMGRPNCFDATILKTFAVAGVRENCPLCKGCFQGRQLLLRHLADTHFKDRMCNGIPDQEGLIYKCPQCNHIARDRQSFVRHYGIVHKMVIKYLNEMGIHTLDDEHRNNSAPQSPAPPRQPQYQNHNDSFSPRGYSDPLRSPGHGFSEPLRSPAGPAGGQTGYFSPHSTPHRSPQYYGAEVQQPPPSYNSYCSPQYLAQSPRNNIGSPQDLSMQYSQQYGQQQFIKQEPQDLSLAHAQDLSTTNKAIDFSPQPGGFPGGPGAPQYSAGSAGIPLHVKTEPGYRSGPGTPQPRSQPGTPQPGPVQPSPAYRQVAGPQYGQHGQEFQQSPTPPVQQSGKKVAADYVPTGDEHIAAPAPGARGPYGIYCVHCNAVKARQPSDFYRHLAETHYKAYLAQFLPAPGNPPYRCPLCPYENKEMSPMIRHYGVAHKKVKEAIGNEIVGRYIPESEMAPCRPAKNQYSGPAEQLHGPTPAQSVFTTHNSNSGAGQEGGQLQVPCPYPDCDMEFSARYAFWQHMCDKHLKEDLLKFIPIMPNQPYQCPSTACNYVTKDSRQALVRHYGMTHKVVQGILGEKFPEFVNVDPFAQTSKLARPKAQTPVREPIKQFHPSLAAPQQHQQQQQYIQHQGQPHIQQVQHQQQPSQQFLGYQHQSNNVGYTQPAQQQFQPSTENFDNLNSLNLDNLNPSDFSIPSLSEFLDNPGAAFPNLSGEDLTHSGYVTAAGHAHSTMQFEPQMDGTFDPTSITDQSLDGSAGSNPTTPEKNKTSMSPANTPQVTESGKKPPPPLKKYCEICGKEYEGKNKSMNKVQHMIHHFKEKLYQSLPPKSEDGLPYKCPEESCKFETKHKPDWARHYGSVHKIVDKMIRQYMEEHPEAWGNQPENMELLREQSPAVVSVPGPSGSGGAGPAPRPQSRTASGPGSDQLDASEGLLCKLTDLQQKSGGAGPNLLPLAPPSRPAAPGQQLVVTTTTASPGQAGRLAVELPKSDLTKFITSALTEKNVPHAAGSAAELAGPSGLTSQQLLEQKVQSVINEQQQILNNQKSGAAPLKSPEPGATAPKQEDPVSITAGQQQPGPAPAASPGLVKQEPQPAQQSLQQLLQTQAGKHQNLLIKTGQQHLVVQTGQGGQQMLLQKAAGKEGRRAGGKEDRCVASQRPRGSILGRSPGKNCKNDLDDQT